MENYQPTNSKKSPIQNTNKQSKAPKEATKKEKNENKNPLPTIATFYILRFYLKWVQFCLKCQL